MSVDSPHLRVTVSLKQAAYQALCSGMRSEASVLMLEMVSETFVAEELRWLHGCRGVLHVVNKSWKNIA